MSTRRRENSDSAWLSVVTGLPQGDDRPPRPVTIVGDSPPAAVPTMRRDVAWNLDLQAWFECYLADCEARGVTARTLEWYRDRGVRILRLFSAAGIRYPEDLSRRAVSELFGALRRLRHRGRPLAPQTIHGYWQVGKGFATFLIAEQAHSGVNPFDEFGRPRVPDRVMWAPSAEDCTAMLRVPNRRGVQGLRDLVILYLLLDTGLRISALAGILVRDIDLQTRRIRVVEKGRRERVVPFGFQALRWVRRYLASAGLRGDDFLLPGQAGKRLSRKRIDEVIKACARAARVHQGRVSAHDLRRAFAREFIRNGGDLESLRQLLGHTSYAMVRRYAELAADVVAEAHGKASPGDHLHL
jgi:site-specific recombinase XerD